MKLFIEKAFINPWIEAFLLSIVFHLIFLGFLWLCCQMHTMAFPPKAHENIIEIEFIK